MWVQRINSNLGPLQEQQVFLSFEPSLQPLFITFLKIILFVCLCVCVCVFVCMYCMQALWRLDMELELEVVVNCPMCLVDARTELQCSARAASAFNH